MSVTTDAINVNDFIIQAYRKIGIEPSKVSDEDLSLAITELNLILKSLTNNGCHLWKIQRGIIPIQFGVATYNMPTNILDFYSLQARSAALINNGTGSTNNTLVVTPPDTGISALFDGIGAHTLTFTPVSAELIDIQYSTANSICPTMVGITLADSAAHNFQFTDLSGNLLLNCAINSGPGLYFFNFNQITNNNGIVLTDTASSLTLKQLAYYTNVTDITLAPYGFEDYMMITNKSQSGAPTIYYVDRQISPQFSVWPIPQPQNNYIAFFYQGYQDFLNTLSLGENLDLVSRFYYPVLYKLALALCLAKGKENLFQMLTILCNDEFTKAKRADSQSGDFELNYSYNA